MSDLFQFVSKNTKTKVAKDVKLNLIKDPVLLANSENPEITFIVDKVYSESYLLTFYKNVLLPIKLDITFQFLYCFKRKPSAKELKTNIGWFYYDNYFDLSKYIPEKSTIISIGSAIYTLTYGNTDLNTETFYDFIFNKTYFYTTLYSKWVYPVDHLYDWNGKDNFKRFFALKQIELALKLKSTPKRIPQLQEIYVRDTSKFLNNYINKKCYVSLDTETTGLDFVSDEVYCLTIAFEDNPYLGYFLKWKDIDLNLLDKFLENKKTIFQNGKFDVLFFKKYGLKNVHISEDTLNLAHCLNEMRGNSLKTLSWLYSYYGGYEQSLENFKRKYRKTKYTEIEEKTLVKYACNDASITMLIWKEMMKQLKDIDENYKEEGKWSLEDYYREIVVPAINLFVDVEYEGVYFDWEGLKKLSIRVKKEIQEKKKEVAKELGLESNKRLSIFNINSDNLFIDEDIDLEDISEDFDIDNIKFEMNIDSNEVIGKILEEQGLPNHGRNKKGIFNVNDETLHKWSKQGYKIADLILELHKLNVIFNSFIGDEKKKSGYFKYRRKDDKLHANFGVCLTQSGRLRCSAPNLQNGLERGYLAKEFKSLFIPPSEEYIKASIDYSGFQLRISTITTKDKEMWKVFTSNNPDLHSKTGYSVLKSLLPDPSISFDGFMELLKSRDSTAKYIRQKAKSCFTKGTEVLTSKGWLKVEEFIPEINSGFHTPYCSDLKIIDKVGKEKEIESTYYGMDHTFIQFELENGDKLKPVTLDHIMKVFKNNKIKSIKAEEIEIGDLMYNLSEDKFLKVSEYSFWNGLQEPVYCLSVKDHELIVKSEKGDKYLIGNCNFQLLFFATSFNFAKTVISLDWTEEECDNYIKKNNLEKMGERLLNLLYQKEENPNETEEEKEKVKGMFEAITEKEFFAKAWNVAIDIRKKHFETYSGLKEWIEKDLENTKEKGYVKSIFGAIRRLPQLLYIGKDDDVGRVKNFLNISLNSPIQNFEIAVIIMAMNRVKKFSIKNNLKTRPYTMIHDSNKFYVYLPEKSIFEKELPKLFEKELPEFQGLPITVDLDWGK
jgi:DNA polymerase I-like protein with 3'-5' exonuclease and polymerase domains